MVSPKLFNKGQSGNHWFVPNLTEKNTNFNSYRMVQVNFIFQNIRTFYVLHRSDRPSVFYLKNVFCDSKPQIRIKNLNEIKTLSK